VSQRILGTVEEKALQSEAVTDGVFGRTNRTFCRLFNGIGFGRAEWLAQKSSRILAARLRPAQTFLRALGIDITFSREGRAGSIIRIRATQENIVSTVSSVCDQPAPRPAGDVCDDDPRSDLVGRYPIGPPVSQPLTMLTVLTQMPAFVSVCRSDRLPTSAPLATTSTWRRRSAPVPP
jgi:hypothetical protein